MIHKIEIEQAHFNTLVDSLTYTCYCFNRQNNPSITSAQWKRVFPNVDDMETLFQAERQLNGGGA